MTAQPDHFAEPAASVITMQSRHDFQTTITRLKDMLAARGIALFADIDQQDAALQVGMNLRPTRLLLFGNPRAGTPIMEANPLAALELPLRAVVWEDERHVVQVTYLDVTQTLGSRYHIDASRYAPLAQIPALLRGVVDEG